MQTAGAGEPLFEIVGNFFKVTLFPINEGVSGGVNGGVSGGVNALLGFIKGNPGKKTAEIKKALNLPQRTLERQLKQLKDEGKIEFRGASRTGGYFLADGR